MAGSGWPSEPGARDTIQRANSILIPTLSRSVVLLAVFCGAAGFFTCQLPTLRAQERRARAIPRPPRDDRSAAQVAEGRRIYNQSCTVCHGLDGAAGDRGPALAGSRRYLRSSDESLFDSMRAGIAGTEMPPSGLPDADIRKVVDRKSVV